MKAEQLEKANQRLAALSELGMQLAAERVPEVLLEKFCSGVRILFGARCAILAMKDKMESAASQVFVSGLAADETQRVQRLLIDAVIADDVLEQWVPRRFSVVSGDTALRLSLAVYLPDVRCGLMAPVVSIHHGYGWILLIDKLGADSFSDDDERTLAVQAAQAGRIYENGSLYTQVRQQVGMLQAQALERERAEVLLRLEHAVARALAVADDMDRGLHAVLRAVCESQHWEVGRYWRADDVAGVLRLAMQWSARDSRMLELLASACVTVLRRGEGLAGRVWLSGQPMWTSDLRLDPLVAQTPLLSANLFPLVSAGRTIGVLTFLSWELREPDARMQASARVIGNQLCQFVQRKNAEAALKASERFNRSTLDSLLEHICVLDSNGVIVTVNRAWRVFAGSEGTTSLRASEGANYLDACAQATRDGAGSAQALVDGIKDVLGGRQAVFAMEYNCDSPTEIRWFLARVSRFTGDGPVRVVVAHEDITERKRAEQRIQRLHRVTTVLSDINALIVRVSDREELFREACRIAVETGHFKKAWVGRLASDPWRMEVIAAHDGGTDTGYFAQIGGVMLQHVAEGEPRFEQMMQHGEAIVENDVATSTWMTKRTEALATGSRSLAALPLVVAKQVVGVLGLHAGEVDFFDDEEIKLLQELAGDMSFAMNHIAQAEQLNRLAYYDALTGQANGMLFNERLAQYLRTAGEGRQMLALAVVDIQRFKSINDTLGRHTGDELLRQVAGRIVDAVGHSHMGRVGPDQFGVMFQDAPAEFEVARMLAEFYQSCFGPAFAIGGNTLRVAANIGIAMYPHDGMDVEALYRNAEAAAKRAKPAAEGVLFYNARMTEVIAEKMALEGKLRDALQNDQFVLYYQPKVDTVTRRIVSVEALIRWQDPESGLVAPAMFIPLMEETGLIVEVGAWALRRAAQDRKRWLESGWVAPRIAVNVSVVQLRRRDFVATVEAALSLGAAVPGIDLEITESAAMEDIGDTVEKLRTLRAQGIDIAIDDFGTGYSSLAYLAKLPIRVLKIDRSFIMTMGDDPNNLTLVATMISLAHSLHMEVVAEGVETEKQAGMLQRLHCDQLQGYLISRPVPEAELVLMLRRDLRCR